MLQSDFRRDQGEASLQMPRTRFKLEKQACDLA